MNKEIKKGEAWRRGYINGCDDGYKRGVVETTKAFGGCKKCYGKGYGTSLEFAEGGGKRWKLPVIKYCDCSRGQQLKELYTEKIAIKKNKRDII